MLLQVWDTGSLLSLLWWIRTVKGGERSLKPRKLGLSQEVTNFKSRDFYSSVNSVTTAQNLFTSSILWLLTTAYFIQSFTSILPVPERR